MKSWVVDRDISYRSTVTLIIILFSSPLGSWIFADKTRDIEVFPYMGPRMRGGRVVAIDYFPQFRIFIKFDNRMNMERI